MKEVYEYGSVSGSEEAGRFVSVVPSRRQLDFMKLEYYNFIHFGINTFYNREWGNGKEDISRFNPKKLDTDQWCRVLKETGSKGIIITAKHHDGFCLFDTEYTDHNVMNTPFGKDIVKMLSESCKKYSLRFGVYLSPWDRHEKTYGTDKYNDFFVSQLTELCTNYGDIFCFWFDGACGEGKNGKKQVYDWERYYSLIRKLQPAAVISVCGPDVRWIGNEGGRVRKSEWSVIPAVLDSNDAVAENSQTDEAQTRLMAVKLDERTEDLGSREVLRNFEHLVFKPAEADVSINLGWFWHNNLYYLFKKRRTAEELAEIYFNCVGGNASMLLNVPPDKSGLINKREIKTLQKFTRLITEPFEKEIVSFCISAFYADGKKRKLSGEVFSFEKEENCLSLSFTEKKQISLLSLREDLAFSQRVEKFKIYGKNADGEFIEVYSGTVIGSRKIIRFRNPVNTDELLITVVKARANPVLKDIRVYG